MAKRKMVFTPEQLGYGGKITVDEIVSYVEQDPQLNYQRVDPWIRNACQKIHNKKFIASKFVPAIEKYLVPEAIDHYMDRKGAWKDESKSTRRVIAARLSRKIIDEAKKYEKSGKRCRLFTSKEAEYYVSHGYKPFKQPR